MNDLDLLRAYAERQTEDAFATLVARHAGLVYSAALRQLREPDMAEEVTQVVFIILARKAGSLRPGTILTGWLLRTARYTAANARRREQRRHNFEREAMNCQQHSSESDAAWERMAPLLDEALVRLSARDRNAVALRFFEGRNFKEVGEALRLNENTARMRVARALERLRRFFARRGVAVSGAVIGPAIAGNASQAAPTVLVTKVTAATFTNGTGATASTLALVKATLESLAWAKFKVAALIGVPALLVVGTATYVAPQTWERFTSQDLVRNGDFEQGLTNWQTIFWAQSQAAVTNEPVSGTGGLAAKFSITRIGLVDTFEFVQAPVPIKAGHTYTISFRARSTVTQPIRVLLTKDKKPWTFYGFRVSAEIGPRWRTYRLSSRAMVTADDGRIVFHCRGAIGDIWLDNIKFLDRGS